MRGDVLIECLDRFVKAIDLVIPRERLRVVPALLPFDERKKIADDYKKVAGFDPAGLNARESFDPPLPKR